MYAKLALAALVSTFVLAPAAEASYLCASPSGAVKLRAECRRSETQIDPDEIGFRGSTGPQGAAGAQGQSGVAGPQGEPGNASDGRSLENLIRIETETNPSSSSTAIYTVPSNTTFILTGAAGAQALDSTPVMVGLDLSDTGTSPSTRFISLRDVSSLFPDGIVFHAGEAILANNNCCQTLVTLSGYLIPDE